MNSMKHNTHNPLILSQVPAGFASVMSADQWGKDISPNIFTFRMHHPIPSYLVALAVGDIASAQIGPRSSVWTEPCLLVWKI